MDSESSEDKKRGGETYEGKKDYRLLFVTNLDGDVLDGWI